MMVPLTVDSGTTDTSFRTKSLLVHAKRGPPPFEIISVGNEFHPVKVYHAVSVPLMLVGKTSLVMLNVRGLESDMARNLLSTGHLFDTMGVRCIMDDIMEMRIPGNDNVVPIHRDDLGLFVVYAAVPSEHASHALVAQTLRNDETALLWHSRMCLTPETLDSFIKHGRGHSIGKQATPAMLKSIANCRVRSAALSRDAPKPKTAPEDVRADKPGMRQVIDGMGPMATRCFVSGDNYIMVAVDEYTSNPIAESTSLHTATEWLAFVDMVIKWYALWNHSVQAVRNDGAGEFRSADYTDGIKQRKLINERCAPHEKDHVGLAEVYVKLIREKARAFVIRAGVPDGFMILACIYATMVIQHLVRRGDTTSRRAQVTGNDGHTERLRVFGCPMDGLIDMDMRRNKCAPVTRRGVFIGITWDGLWIMWADHAVWLIRNRASFYEVGLVREGVLPKHGTYDVGTQTSEESGPTAAPAPTLASPPAVTGTGPRPDGGHHHTRSSARTYLSYCSEQQRIAEASSAKYAEALFASAACESADDASAVKNPENCGESLAFAATRDSKAVHCIGPQGPYIIEQPNNHGAMTRCKDAPEWKRAQQTHVNTITSHSRIITVPRSEPITKGAKIYAGHWVYDVRIVRTTGWLGKLKARYVLDGQWWNEGGDTWAAFPPPEVINIMLAVAAVQGRRAMLIDVKDFFQEHSWPDDEPRYLEMPPDHVQYDDKNIAMVWRSDMLFWGAPVASNTVDQATLQFYSDIGAEKMECAPRCHRIRTAGGEIHALTHADDNLITFEMD